jgi:hypothetical protein
MAAHPARVQAQPRQAPCLRSHAATYLVGSGLRQSDEILYAERAEGAAECQRELRTRLQIALQPYLRQRGVVLVRACLPVGGPEDATGPEARRRVGRRGQAHIAGGVQRHDLGPACHADNPMADGEQVTGAGRHSVDIDGHVRHADVVVLDRPRPGVALRAGKRDQDYLQDQTTHRGQCVERLCRPKPTHVTHLREVARLCRPTPESRLPVTLLRRSERLSLPVALAAMRRSAGGRSTAGACPVTPTAPHTLRSHLGSAVMVAGRIRQPGPPCYR